MASTAIPSGFGGLPRKFTDPRTAQIAILPVPYDGTSTWKKGADRGPAAIIDASANMELYDIETESEVYQRGISTLRPLRHRGSPDSLATKVEAAIGKLWDNEKFPVLLGGEHSVSIGAFRAAAKRFKNLSILQIDAHGDTRESYHGSSCNHACVMARARELAPITQVGIRAIDIEETPGVAGKSRNPRTSGMDRNRVFFAHEILGQLRGSGRTTKARWIDRVVNQQSKNVYVTIDLDAFDPAYLPATGTPEPGGLTWADVNALLARLGRKRNVIGFDLVELLPHPAHWASNFLAAKLVYRFLSEVFAKR